MQFIDNLGHIFETQSYNINPIGYEYETMPYVFWFDSEYSNKLSVNNYYVLPVRMLFKSSDNIVNISIENIKSDIYSFGKISSENLEINENSLVKELSYDHVYFLDNIPVKDSEDLYKVGTFYVFGCTDEEGTWMTTMNIHIEYDDRDEWCPITVAGSYVDEIEQLTINANNIGVRLPKDIIKAVYQGPGFTDVLDENLYNIKIKEYLINHMTIKGQCGNYNSAIAALKWFGWGDNIELSKLLLTDNEFMEQYIHDYFDINGDILSTFKKFRNTTYIALTVYANRETEKRYTVDSTQSLWGEGKPILENLFDKTQEVDYNGITFLKSYYDYNFNEMSYKLACLAYMYNKYFLPIHLSIHSASIQERVFANDIKLLTKASVSLTEKPILISESNNSFSEVYFDNKEKYILHNQSLYLDDNYNIFNYYDEDFCKNSDNNFTFVENKLSAVIPIYFNGYINNELASEFYYDCVMIFSRNGNIIKENKFSFCQSPNKNYVSFAIVPLLYNELTKTNSDFWEEAKFTIDLCCNGIWYKHEFRLEIPEFSLEFGKLQYSYDPIYHKQLNEVSSYSEGDITKRYIDFNAVMYEPGLATISNSNFNIEIKNIIDNLHLPSFDDSYDNSYSTVSNINLLNDYIKLTNQEVKINDNDKYYNKIHIYNIIDESGRPVLFTDRQPFDGTKEEYNFNENTILLYNMFFDKEGNIKDDILTYISDSEYAYDFYLMHDSSKYYAVFISRDTIDKAPINEKINKTIIYEQNDTYNEVVLKPYEDTVISISDSDPVPHKFIFKHYKSDTIFLLNRMKLISSEGVNHFDNDDIICAKVTNFENLPYIMALGSKWNFENISIGDSYIEPVESKTDTAIISIDKDHLSYVKGYYNVSVNYSVDDFYNHTKTLFGKIRIN